MNIKTVVAKLSIILAVVYMMVPSVSQAASVTSRVLALGSSAPSAVTTYNFSFKPGTSGNIGAIKFQICDSPVETVGCVNTLGSSGESFTSNSASISTQSGISGFSVAGGTPPAPTANTLFITNASPQNIPTTTTVSVTLQNVRNPSSTNTEFWGRITTYSDAAGSIEVDYGAVAVSTATQIIVSGTMPESLVFCVGTAGTDCTNLTGSAVSLGIFSPTATSTGTSVMSASTNAGSGYAITINGTTLTSGSNTVTPLGTQTLNSSSNASSATGASQFGTNVENNTTPAIGAAISGTGTGLGAGGYGTANSFRFFNGDAVASATGPTKANLFTNSYIVNVGGDQAAGVYTSTLTYICTATF